MSGEAAGAAAPAAPAPAAAAPAAAETKAPVEAKPAPEVDDSEEYTVDGKQVRLSRAQRALHIQKGLGADKRMQEATEAKKRSDEIIKLFETDPEAALAKMGKDPEKFIAEHLAKRAKAALQTPEQRELARVQKERDDLAAKAKEIEDREARQKQAEQDRATHQALEQQIIAAADKHGLDSSPEVLEGLCDIALEFLDHGVSISPDQLAQEYLHREEELLAVREQKLLPKLKGQKLKAYLKSNLPALLSLPAAELLEILGPEGVRTIQSATLTKVPSPAKPKPPPAPLPPRTAEGRWRTEAEIVKKFGR